MSRFLQKLRAALCKGKRLLARCAKKRGFFPAACYAVCLAGWLLLSLAGLGRDAALRADGRLAPFQLLPAELELVNAEWQPGDVLYTLTDDPQLIWHNPDGRAVRTLRFTARYAESAREMCLYYTTVPNEPFSQDKRVFAAQSSDGASYLYTLPQVSIAALRLDPCSSKQNEVTVGGIQCNEPVSVLSYFSPGWYGAFQMAIWPGLIAALLDILHQLAGLAAARRRARPGPDAPPASQ